LASYNRATIKEHYEDIYSLPELPQSDLVFKTYYEKKHLADSKTIKYIQFHLDID